MFKIQTLLALTILVATSVNCQQRVVKGCALWKDIRKTCEVCYERKPIQGGCGPQLPPTDPCALYVDVDGQASCIICKPGYGAVGDGTCTPVPIFNCNEGVSHPDTCLGCGNGQYPSEDDSTCIPAPQGKGVPNCLVGRRLFDSLGCNRCAPGYVVNYPGTACYAQTAQTVGCMQLTKDMKGCYLCDVYAGYSMQKNLKCKFVKQ